jgi:DNA-binding IclR family transcriptional regulator
MRARNLSIDATSQRRPKGERLSKSVPAVARAIRVLDAVAAAEKPLSLSRLQEALSLPKSTLHGLCATLVQGGLLRRSPDGTYQLGLRVMDLAHAFVARTELAVDFAEAWEALAVLPDETFILSVLDGADVVYVACRNGRKPLGLNFRIGMRLPAACTASGKSMLSTIAKDDVSALLRAAGFRRLTRASVRSLAMLHRQLDEVRRRGFAMDDEETRNGMLCFGAPVFDAHGAAAIAGVAVSLLKAEASSTRRVAAADAVVRFAAMLSKRLGAGTAPDARESRGRRPR